MTDEQERVVKPDGHVHGWYDPNCVAIAPNVCLRETTHGGSPDIRNADGSIAGGDTQHIAGFIMAHDIEPGQPRCEGNVSVDPHFGDHPIWSMTGSLEGGDLTLSPSVLCGDGFHGFVQQGKWVSA